MHILEKVCRFINTCGDIRGNAVIEPITEENVIIVMCLQEDIVEKEVPALLIRFDRGYDYADTNAILNRVFDEIHAYYNSYGYDVVGQFIEGFETRHYKATVQKLGFDLSEIEAKIKFIENIRGDSGL